MWNKQGGQTCTIQADAEEHWRGMSVNYNVTIDYFAFPALDVPLDVNANGHSKQFKHSCIVQPGRWGFHCNKSNVTALGGGARDCHCLNKLYEALRRYFNREKETLIHSLFKIWVLQNYWLCWSAAACVRLSPSTCSLIKECHQCTHLVIHRAGAWVCMHVCVYIWELAQSFQSWPSQSFEDPLTPSLPERPLVSVNYPQYLQLPAHQVSAPIWSSRRQQAGRGGESAGYLWDTDYISCR